MLNSTNIKICQIYFLCVLRRYKTLFNLLQIMKITNALRKNQKGRKGKERSGLLDSSCSFRGLAITVNNSQMYHPGIEGSFGWCVKTSVFQHPENHQLQQSATQTKVSFFLSNADNNINQTKLNTGFCFK